MIDKPGPEFDGYAYVLTVLDPEGTLTNLGFYAEDRDRLVRFAERESAGGSHVWLHTRMESA